MAIHTYLKQNNSPKKKAITYFSYVSLTIGSLLLFWSFYPVVSFEIYSRIFLQKKTDSPIPTSQIASSLQQANSILGTYNIFSGNIRDFTQANLWFPTIKQESAKRDMSLKNYSLSIAKLNIKDAKVTVAGDDLAKSLVHYFPQSLPGEFGNIVIFGHSTLPQLYNTKDYKTIFTYLPSLEKGDNVDITANGVNYQYQIYDMFVVDPDQVSVLEQKTDASYLTLITCVPPGTYWKRLVVRAKLTNLP